MARQIANTRQARERNAQLAQQRAAARWRTSSSRSSGERSRELNLSSRATYPARWEALEDALVALDVGDEVSLRIIDRGVGAITETNVMLAAASDAVIIGFNVRPEGGP